MSRNKFSLRRQLLLWLTIPLIAFWLAGSALSYYVAVHYADTLIDRTLMQSARSLLYLIRPEIGGLEVDFARVYRLLQTEDPNEVFYYAVTAVDGSMVLGNRRLPLPEEIRKDGHGQQVIFTDTTIDDTPVRIATMVMPIAYKDSSRILALQIAKGMESRKVLYRNILIGITLPLSALTLLIAYMVWLGIGRGLRPLARLQDLAESRDPQDLSPLEMENAPQEVSGLTRALNHLLKSTEESIGRQRRFIADAAHQLRTPLAGLKSQTELAMRETTPEALRERLNMVHTSATRSIHLVNQLLTLARSEPGSNQGIPTIRMDLARQIRELTAEAVPRALANDLDLGCDCALTEAWMEGNSALLRELFVNLVENAIKYTHKGGSITVRLNDVAGEYVVEVEDNGPGIPDVDKQRVFERFYRRNQDGNGCGLGMAIVREIAERHQGQVVLLDAEPQGLIVRVTLPHD